MVPMSVHPRAADARGACRASLYLAAALYCDGASSPIKIRNISSTGALVEGDTPAVGTLVQLVRGGLIVHALVAWSDGGRCGLKFSGRIDVQQWRSAPGHLEQQRVDEVVRLIKAGAVPLPIPPLSYSSDSEVRGLSGGLAQDLGRVSDLLEALGSVLASDPDVVTKHGTALQNLDIAMQVISAVEEIILPHGDPESETAKLSALRRSADQALLQRL